MVSNGVGKTEHKEIQHKKNIFAHPILVKFTGEKLLSLNIGLNKVLVKYRNLVAHSLEPCRQTVSQ